MAQAPVALPGSPALDTAGFLASLAAGASEGQNGVESPSLPPNQPVFLTGCTSSSQCPKGQLCCLACGYAGCETYACFAPMNGHCPFFP